MLPRLLLLILIPVLCFVQNIFADEQNLFNLNEIVVTATKTPHLLKDVPIETYVITEKDIKDSPAQTVSELLRNIPGIFVRAENVPGISAWRTKIRGFDVDSGYALVLINGERVKGGGMGEYGIGVNQIPLEMIKRIEIVKGPSSVLYGSDALVGVINIITKTPPKKLKFGLDGAAGTHNVRIFNSWVGGSHKKIGAFLNFNHEESDVGQYGYNSTQDNDYYRNRLDSNYFLNFNKYIKLSLNLNLEHNDRKRTYKTTGVKRHSTEDKYRISPKFDIKFKDDSFLKVKGYWYKWNFSTSVKGGTSPYTPRIGDMYYYNTEVQYTKQIGDNHLFTAGTEWLEEKLDYNLAQHVTLTKSFYLQDEITFSIKKKDLYLVIGGRIDDNSVYGSEFCPKTSLLFEWSKSTKLRFSIGKGFKSPTIRQLYYKEPFHHGNKWIKSNPDLEPEKSLGYSFNIEKIFNKNFLFTISLFRNDVKDKVIQVETNEIISGEPVYTYENVSKAHSQGIEINLSAELFKNFNTIIGYTYLETEDEDTHKELTYCPKHTLNGRIVYNITSLGLILNFGTQYVSKMYKDANNTKKIDPYFLSDFKVIKKIYNLGEISLEGNNIFNSDYGEPERDWAGATYLLKLSLNF